MITVFYISAAVAVAATALVVTRAHAVHALLYLVVSLLAVAMVFVTLGAPFVAALEVIIYAGAIMVLFVFVIMMLNLGAAAQERERQWLAPSAWAGPAALALVLLAELLYVLAAGGGGEAAGGPGAPLPVLKPGDRLLITFDPPAPVGPKEVGAALFGPYLVGVELASMLLLAGLVAAYHLARREALSPGNGQEAP